ncbi:unnamed protein product [Litomosoides sigmodontis]|uniref:Uncharacterized protein n=1 Tax=Litomosoides sigmodontis TaxID=42156 RepID=A0A3P6TSC8_LITSI|nr:unnamed protein product [Litomosoides sigmodontis]
MSEAVKVAALASSSESRLGALCGPFEVTARVERLLCDVIDKAEAIAREIWPSDGGLIELNRKELKRFIINNKAGRPSVSKMSRHMAGRSSLEHSTGGSSKQGVVRDDNVLVTESIIQPCRSDLCKIHQYKEVARNPSQFNSTLTDSDENVKTQQQPHMQGNFPDASSQTSLTSITQSPETLISSETIDLRSSTADESSSSNRHESLIGPTMKPDGTVVIPGVVHVNNFESLNGVVLELKVLIKSPNESKRIDVKIDCPEFTPKSVIVNGIETHRLIDHHCKTF